MPSLAHVIRTLFTPYEQQHLQQQQTKARPALFTPLEYLFTPTTQSKQETKTNPDLQTLLMYGNQPVAHSLPRNYQSFASDGYRVDGTSYKCISYIARNGGAIPPILYTDKTKQEKIETHPLLDLLAHPNNEQGGVAYRESVLGFLLIGGNSYQYAIGPNNNPPDELWALRPDWMEIVPGRQGITGYKYKPEKQLYTPTEIGHIKYWCPDDALYGLSPMEVAAILIDQQMAARKWNLALLQNWARPPGAWIIQSPIGKNERERLEQKLKEKMQGYRNAGAPPVLDGGLSWQQMGVVPAQMDWLAGLQLNAATIANIFNIPPMVIGDTSASTFDNMKQAEIYSYTEAIFPDLDKLYDLWNMWLVPRYPDLRRAGACLYYDKESVEVIQEMIQAQKDAQSKRATTVYMSGLATFNEARELQGLPAIKGGDYIRMGTSLIPLAFLKKGEIITASPAGIIANPVPPENGRPTATPQLPPGGEPKEPIPAQTGQENVPVSRQAGATATGKFNEHHDTHSGRFASGGGTGGGGGGTLASALDNWFEYDYGLAMREVSRGGTIEAGYSSGGQVFTPEEVAQVNTEAHLLQDAASTTQVKSIHTVYRGESYEDEAALQAAYPNNKKIKTDGLTATTTEKTIAQDYANTYLDTQINDLDHPSAVRAVITIQNPNGVIGIKRPNEPEVILPHGAEYRVVRVFVDDNSVHQVSLYSTQKLPKPPKKYTLHAGPHAQKRYKAWEAWTEDALMEELDGWFEEGVTHLRWSCLFMNTCTVCQQNDGQVVEVGEQFGSGAYLPPVHPNCMCQVYPIWAETPAKQALSEAERILARTATKYNPYHDPHSGQFGTGGHVYAQSHIENAQTTKELETAMGHVFPNATFTLNGMDVGLAKRVCMQFHSLGTRYPEVAQSLNKVKAFKGDKNYTAFASSGKFGPSTEIFLNTTYFSSPAKFQSALDQLAKKSPGYLASPSVEGIVAHEFGHLVYFHMMHNKDGEYQGRPVKEPLKAWLNANKENGDAVSGYAKSGGRAEAWAEGFSQLHTLQKDDWSVYAADMNNFLTRMYPDGHPAWRTPKKYDDIGEVGTWEETIGQFAPLFDDEYSSTQQVVITAEQQKQTTRETFQAFMKRLA